MNDIINRDLIEKILKYWRKDGKVTELENALNYLKTTFSEWSKTNIFGIRIAMIDSYTKKTGVGFITNLCKHISILTINKICYIETISLKAITKQKVNFATELKLIKEPKLIPIANIKYIHYKANPVSGIKFIILDELSSIHSDKKHIPLNRDETQKIHKYSNNNRHYKVC